VFLGAGTFGYPLTQVKFYGDRPRVRLQKWVVKKPGKPSKVQILSFLKDFLNLKKP